MGRRLALAFLVVLVTVAGPCSASRKLQQNDAAAGLAAVPAAAAASLEAELPAAAPATVVSNIQLNAPGTSDLLSAPALAPASGPLPAGIVSLQAKNGGSVAQQTAQLNEQMERAAATPQTRIPASPGRGEYSTIAGIDNSGKSLPAGESNKPLSASQLAAIQAKDAKVAQTASNAATVETPAGSTSDGQQVVVKPTGTTRNTVDQVNAVAPTYQVSKSLSVKPQLATATGLASRQGNGVGRQTRTLQATSGGQQGNGVGSQTRTSQATSGGQKKVASTKAYQGASTTPITVGGQTVNVFIPTIGNPEEATGDYISFINGVRIATPFFGTGYNFCIDRYFGSFPKVGIVIPNAAAWLLPEFQDVATALESTLDLPSILPHGARVDPTADGFLIWLPTFQPSQVPELGIRYGIQIGQAFGYDFGFGIVKQICFVSFAIV